MSSYALVKYHTVNCFVVHILV